MIPPFRVLQPATVAEASELLTEHGDDAVLYAGGTELLLVMKLGFADYTTLIDVKRLPELSVLDVDGSGALVIGGAVTYRRIERSPFVQERWSALAAMARQVANVRVRTVGTLGGNLCFADPHSDPATFLLAAGARVVAQRAGAPARSIPLERFTVGMFETALHPDELLVRVEVPALEKAAAMAHEKFAVHERPSATVSCHVQVREGQLCEARVAIGSVGARPVRAREAERILEGNETADLGQELFRAAGAAGAAEANPVADEEGSADYKRHLAQVLTDRALRSAVQRALISDSAPQ